MAKVTFFGCFVMFLTIFDRISIFHRRKSALPKYDPPYAKRQMLKGYSHPNSPHPSQHLTPDHTFEDAGKLGGLVSGKLGGLGNFPPYRPVEWVLFYVKYTSSNLHLTSYQLYNRRLVGSTDQAYSTLVTQPMLQLRPNPTEVRSMDYFL